MKQGKKLLILPAVAVLLGMVTGCSGANRILYLAVSMLP